VGGGWVDLAVRPHNWVEPTTTTTPPHKLLRYFQATQEYDFRCATLTRWFMEDNLNIFENGRRPHFFPNLRWPQFYSMQPRELVFGMQHCFNPTRWNMKDDLNFFENGRRPQFSKNGRWPHGRWPIFLENGRQPRFFDNGRWPQIFENKRRPSFLKMEDDLIFFKWMTTYIVWTWNTTLLLNIEDDLNFC
jgi:hypothetical protein